MVIDRVVWDKAKAETVVVLGTTSIEIDIHTTCDLSERFGGRILISHSGSGPVKFVMESRTTATVPRKWDVRQARNKKHKSTRRRKIKV